MYGFRFCYPDLCNYTKYRSQTLRYWYCSSNPNATPDDCKGFLYDYCRNPKSEYIDCKVAISDYCEKSRNATPVECQGIKSYCSNPIIKNSKDCY